jgi:predicted nucleic acid-binding protein
MNTYVIDASVAAKWFFNEEHSDSARRALSEENRLHAPDLVLLEMDSLLCKRLRRSEITSAEASEIRKVFHKLPIQKHHFVTLLDPAYEIANQVGCSIYDAVYLALAVLLKAGIATADGKLFKPLKKSAFADFAVWVDDL